MMRKFGLVPFLFVLAISMLYGMTLLGSSYIPTHDGEYHIIRFMEFYKMLASGYLFPRWAPTLNSGYGLPLFNFHYPFPNYIGALFYLGGLQFVDSFKLTLFSAYLISLVSCFLWLTRLSTRWVSAQSTLIVASIPYWFVDIYVRGSVGEIWAMAFVFTSLYLMESPYPLFAAVSVCLLILSHNILALLFLPILLVYACIRSKVSILYILLGLMLSAYFWLPALVEKGYMVGLNSVGYKDHFVQLYELLVPSWGSGFSGLGTVGNKVSFQVGIVPLLMLLLALWYWVKEKNRRIKGRMSAVFVTLMLSVFLMLESSLVLWRLLPPLGYMQYPWRLLSVVIFCISLLSLYVFSRIKKPWISGVICLLSIFFVFSYTRPVEYAPRNDHYYRSRPNFTDGTSSLGNSLSTIWTPWKEKKPILPVQITTGAGKVDLIRNTYLDKTIAVYATQDSTVVVNTLYFPGWVVFEGKRNIAIDFTKNGIIEFKVPKGDHTVRVQFQETPIRTVADMISLLGLGIVFTVSYIQLKKGIHERRH